MKLIIGGFGQGMLDVALGASALSTSQVADGACCSIEEARGALVVDNLHLLIRREMQAGRDPKNAVSGIVRQNPDICFICQELGCGVVPVDSFERLWREETGRICCQLARQAASVERVFCSIATVIKGE